MSRVLSTEPCPDCQAQGEDNSGNNRVLFTDNAGYWCFRCNAGTPVTAEAIEEDNDFVEIEYIDFETRRISSATLRHAKCGQAKYTGFIGTGTEGRMLNAEWVHVFQTFKDGKLIAQKLKTHDKLIKWIGKAKGEIPLFLQDLWSPNPNMFVTVTEGEDDALSCLQVQGYQFPVVSISKGSGTAKKELEASLKWLLGFKYVILGFDSDSAGSAAADACLSLFEPGKVRVTTWSAEGFNGKDANDMLKANKAADIKKCLFSAKEIIPKHIVTVSDVLAHLMIRPEFGATYPWDTMTAWTYGMQPGEINVIVGATGIGKTEFVKDLVFHWLDRGDKVGLFSFEHKPAGSLKRLVGAKIGVKIHLPGEVWNENLIKAEAEKLEDKIYFYDKAGRVDITDLLNSIRYLVLSRNVRIFVIDNLKALGLAGDYDKAEYFMNTLKSMAMELQFDVFLLSHVAKDKYNQTVYTTTSPKNPGSYYEQTAESTDKALRKPGLDWESGRSPTENNVEGSGIITALADYVWGLSRNKVSDDNIEKKTLRVKMLKSGKLAGEHCGNSFNLVYTKEGVLKEKGSIDTSNEAF